MTVRKRKNDIVYAMSLAVVHDDWKAALESLNEFHAFRGIELSPALMENPGLHDVLCSRDWFYVHCDRLLQNMIAHRMAEQASSMVHDFVINFEKEVERLKSFYADSFTVDFEIESVMNDSVQFDAMLGLYKKFIPVIYNNGIKLCISVKIPHVSERSADFYLHFLRSLMFPGISFSLDIYPHKLDADCQPEALLRFLKFDTACVRFIYEAGLGNHLVQPQIESWIKTLRKAAFKGAIVFVPVGAGFELFKKEASVLQEIISSVDKN